MSKTCTNCGMLLDDDTAFCVTCGAPAPAAETEPVVAPAPVAKKNNNSFDINKLINKVKSDKKLLIACCAVAAVIVILFATVAISLIPAPWESAMNNFIALSVKGNSRAVTKAAPNAVWEWVDDEYHVSKDDIKDISEKIAEDLSEDVEDEFGKNPKMTYKVVKSKKMTKTMVEAYGEALENHYDIDAKTVKAGYVVELDLEVSGKDAFDWDTGTFYFVRIGTSWYMVSEVSINSENPSCSITALSMVIGTNAFQKESR